MGPGTQQIQVMMSEAIRQGRFANHLQVTNMPDHAILDFTLINPVTGGDLVARIVVSPEFLRQIAGFLTQQANQPKPSAPDNSKTQTIGFQADSIEAVADKDRTDSKAVS